VLVSKDLPMRVKASAVGLDAQEYRAELAVDSGGPAWPTSTSLSPRSTSCTTSGHRACRGGSTCRVTPGWCCTRRAAAPWAASPPTSRSASSAGDRDAFGLHGRSAEQRIALDLLLDPDVGIVSLGGRAGTGKSALALCAGLEAVLERRQHRKVVVFRPCMPSAARSSATSRARRPRRWARGARRSSTPWGRCVDQEVVEEIVDRGMLEVLPLTHIRGRSLHDAFVIVDEAQSLERNVLLTVLSRVGQNSRRPHP
jgi:PhoH-like ATPase